MAAQTIPVGTRLLSDLRKSEVVWPESLETLKATQSPTKVPRVHQSAPSWIRLPALSTATAVGLLMACGSGKTLTSLWLAERIKAQRSLVLVPSLSLLSQTLGEWAANCSEDFAFLPVCSDGTVGDRDQMKASVAELGVPATTDAQAIADFLQKPGRRVVFFYLPILAAYRRSLCPASTAWL